MKRFIRDQIEPKLFWLPDVVTNDVFYNIFLPLYLNIKMAEYKTNVGDWCEKQIWPTKPMYVTLDSEYPNYEGFPVFNAFFVYKLFFPSNNLLSEKLCCFCYVSSKNSKYEISVVYQHQPNCELGCHDILIPKLKIAKKKPKSYSYSETGVQNLGRFGKFLVDQNFPLFDKKFNSVNEALEFGLNNTTFANEFNQPSRKSMKCECYAWIGKKFDVVVVSLYSQPTEIYMCGERQLSHLYDLYTELSLNLIKHHILDSNNVDTTDIFLPPLIFC